MTDGFHAALLDALDAEIRKRGRGRFRALRAHLFPDDETAVLFPNRGRGQARAAWASAIGEAGEGFTADERAAFLADGTLPAWFWPAVEERAKYWLDVQHGRR